MPSAPSAPGSPSAPSAPSAPVSPFIDLLKVCFLLKVCSVPVLSTTITVKFISALLAVILEGAATLT